MQGPGSLEQRDTRMPTKRKPKVRELQKRTSPVFDPVAEAGAESFPASDAPSWTSGEADRQRTKKKRPGR
jgi:hypothetical protein